MDTLGMAQPMAIAAHCIARSRLAPGDIAVIVGAGGICAFLTYAAAQTGAEVWVLGLDPDRLIPAAALGAHRVVEPLDQRHPIKLLVEPAASNSRPAHHNRHPAKR